MPTTTLPDSKQKAHDTARKIANERPLKKDRNAPESHVTGGFNQKAHRGAADTPPAEENSATEGDGQ